MTTQTLTPSDSPPDSLNLQATVQRLPFLLPPVVFIIHTLEEIPDFAEWATKHFGDETTEAFVAYHIPLILLVGFVSWRAVQPGARRGWVVAISAAQWQFGINALFHLAAWIALGEYSPGALTGAVVSLPATVFYFNWLRRHDRATPRDILTSIALGTLIAASAIGFLFI